MISDAALALDHGLAVVSADSDFARFPELTWLDPLVRCPRWEGHLRPRAMAGKSPTMASGTYRVKVGSQDLEIPLVPIARDLTIALLISVDLGVAFAEVAGSELAGKLAPCDVEIVVSVATMGIPIAIEVTRALGMDDYVILHKTPKIHLGDAISEPVHSITTRAPQTLLFDRARLGAVRGRRVAVVDDVISTGGSTRAALNLMRRVGAKPVVVGALVTEGSQWRTHLGADADLVRSLGAIPLFRHGPQGELVEDWEGLGGSSTAEALHTRGPRS
ncbi:MAG: phosphoribosyltransferase family protein [Acidimicrobiales bacterium]